MHAYKIVAQVQERPTCCTGQMFIYSMFGQVLYSVNTLLCVTPFWPNDFPLVYAHQITRSRLTRGIGTGQAGQANAWSR